MKRYQKYVVLLKQVMIILQKSFLLFCLFLYLFAFHSLS